jgi:hypothetical protein
MRKTIIMGAVVATALALLGNTALAAGTSKRLHFDTCSTSDSIGWARGSDSPLDGNHQALLATVGSDHGANPPYNCAEAYSLGSGIEGLPVADVKNLSFDFLTADAVGHGGVPRISVVMRDTNGTGALHFAYLGAGSEPTYCGQQIGTSDWSRADFTGRTTAGCTLYDENGTPYTSNGVLSAWGVFAAAHSDYQVVLATDSVFGGGPGAGAFLVMDEAGTYHADRLAIQNHMWIRNLPQYIKNCPSETSC